MTELLQDDVQPGKIEAELARLLFDDKAGSEMRLGLAEIRSKLGNPGASRQAATLAFKLLGRNK